MPVSGCRWPVFTTGLTSKDPTTKKGSTAVTCSWQDRLHLGLSRWAWASPREKQMSGCRSANRSPAGRSSTTACSASGESGRGPVEGIEVDARRVRTLARQGGAHGVDHGRRTGRIDVETGQAGDAVQDGL